MNRSDWLRVLSFLRSCVITKFVVLIVRRGTQVHALVNFVITKFVVLIVRRGTQVLWKKAGH